MSLKIKYTLLFISFLSSIAYTANASLTVQSNKTYGTDVLDNALIKAAKKGNIKKVETLIKDGANTYSIQTYVNAASKYGGTPLIEASRKGTQK